MSDLILQQLSNKEKDQLRTMFFAGYDCSIISEKLNIDIATVRFYVFGADEMGQDPNCLTVLKKRLSSATIAVFVKSKIDIFDKVTGLAIDILNLSLTRLRDDILLPESDIRLSVAEMKQISDIVTAMDKIVRLESGTATENIIMKGLSLAESQDILRNDPFAGAIETECSVIEKPPWVND